MQAFAVQAIEFQAMTDLELIDKIIEAGLDMISPLLFRDLRARGLVHYIDRIGTNDIAECKAIVRARFARNGKYNGDPEIEHISGVVSRLEALRDRLQFLPMTNPIKTLKILSEMTELSETLRDYFKPTRIP